MNAYLKIVALSMVLLIIACKQEYPLPDETRNLNLLVVEGILNSGQGPTVVRLTRSVNPKDSSTIKPELRAVVSVEGENNTSFKLTGNTRGEYTHNQLNLNTNIKYRVRIRTENGKEYLSDFVPVQPSPQIDSIYWRRTDNQIQLFASTHDPQNKTWYYRWDYDETWENNSAFPTFYEYKAGSVVPRANPFEIYYCWSFSSSSRILLNSSAKLSQDVIRSQPLTSIAIGSERISVRYSILVRQYALSKEAYEFWEIMRKNTEQVGTLFDPQPSQFQSNVRSLGSSDEPVIGFVSAGSYAQKRLFISRAEVEPWRYNLYCELKIVTLDSFQYYFNSRTHVPVNEWYDPMSGRFGGYESGTTQCVDCRTFGTTVKPSYW